MAYTCERRWIIIADDGRHVTIGRLIDPTEEEIAAAAEALSRQGLGGWLAVMEGDYYQPRLAVGLLEVRQLGFPKTSWIEAKQQFQRTRHGKVSTAD